MAILITVRNGEATGHIDQYTPCEFVRHGCVSRPDTGALRAEVVAEVWYVVGRGGLAATLEARRKVGMGQGQLSEGAAVGWPGVLASVVEA
jgi:hypothetical protein